MRGEYSADAAEEHATDQTQARCRARIDAFQGPATSEYQHDCKPSAAQPEEKLATPEKLQQLVEIMGWFGESTKGSD